MKSRMDFLTGIRRVANGRLDLGEVPRWRLGKAMRSLCSIEWVSSCAWRMKFVDCEQVKEALQEKVGVYQFEMKKIKENEDWKMHH